MTPSKRLEEIKERAEIFKRAMNTFPKDPAKEDAQPVSLNARDLERDLNFLIHRIEKLERALKYYAELPTKDQCNFGHKEVSGYGDIAQIALEEE